MAALLTSVMTNVNKISEYIYNCRQMEIEILPPDINEGAGNFTPSNHSIRYGLSAIKGLGKPVIDAIVSEREANGKYLSVKDFAERLSGKEVNKRTIESFIKSGSMDSLPGTRKQKMIIYIPILESIHQDRKKNLEGQMSLFDFVSEESKQEYEIKMPDVGEYEKEELLAFEKEMLGIYISGHPMEEYEELWKKNITRTTRDFLMDEETGIVRAIDGETAIIGGMISSKIVKTTKTNSIMAFLVIEDLLGSMEVIIFPKNYEKNKSFLVQDNKVFIRGKVKVEEDKPAKLICQEVIPFEKIPREIWIKFPNKKSFIENQDKLYHILSEYDGNDMVCIFCEYEKAIKRLPSNKTVKIEKNLIERLELLYSKENVKVMEKSIEKHKKID